MKRVSTLLLTLGLSLLVAAPTSAQLEPWKDYEASSAVWHLTTVNLEPGTLGIYLEGLKQTWVAAHEVSKQLGHIEEYAIYANQAPAGEDFDLLLVIKMAKTADMEQTRERYNEFMAAWGESNQANSNKTVLELYNEIREISGEAFVREITIK